MGNILNEVRHKTLTSSAHIIIDDNNMLLFSLYGGVYHFEIDKMTCEFVGLLKECIKKRYKVRSVFNVDGKIFVVFDNTYNIVEYCLASGNEKQLTNISDTPSNVVDSFLINGKLWIFPYELKDRIMSYDIENLNTEFYSIDDVIADGQKMNVDLFGSRIFHLSYGARCVWTTLKADHYGIKFEFNGGLKAQIYELDSDFNYAGVDYIDGSLYLPVVGEERADRYDLDFRYIESVQFDEGNCDKDACYRNIARCGPMLFAIPYTHDGIQYIACRSGKKGNINFPKKFKKNVLPFWKAILLGDRLILPPYYSNMLLVIDGSEPGNHISLQSIRIERDTEERRLWLNYMFHENETWTLSKFIEELDLYPSNETIMVSNVGKKIYEYAAKQEYRQKKG